jgi:hypothetical protein
MSVPVRCSAVVEPHQNPFNIDLFDQQNNLRRAVQHHQHQAMSAKVKKSTSTTAANMLQQQHQHHQYQAPHNIFGEGGLGTQPDAAGLAVLIASSNTNNNHLYQQQVRANEPVHSTEELFTKLQEALSLEPKYQPNLYLPQDSQVSTILCLFILSLRSTTTSPVNTQSVD